MIVGGITLIWQKGIAAIHIIAIKTTLVLFKFGGRTKNRQTAKLKSPPNKLHMQYMCR